MDNEFVGAKAALFIGGKLLITLRDDVPDIPFPNVWDLPGGGREGDETPLDTLNREVMEEVGLTIPSEAIVWQRAYSALSDPARSNWFFVALMPDGFVAEIACGDEGQGWTLIDLEDFFALTRVVPFFAARICDWLDDGGAAHLRTELDR